MYYVALSASFYPLFSLEAYFSFDVFTLNCGNVCTTLPLKDCSTLICTSNSCRLLQFSSLNKEASMTAHNESECLSLKQPWGVLLDFDL